MDAYMHDPWQLARTLTDFAPAAAAGAGACCAAAGALSAAPPAEPAIHHT